MKALFNAAFALMMSMLAAVAPAAEGASSPLELTGIAWEMATAATGEARLRLSHKRSSSDVALDGSRRELAGARAALARTAAGPVDFTIVHEAGTLRCTGRLAGAFDGEGTCRFAADPGFRAALAARGLAPEERSGQLTMLMVDATIALADGLADEGVGPEDAGGLVAAAALGVTPGYVRELKAAPLVLTNLGDAVACRALDVDGAYVRGLAAAGYAGLTADDAVEMKAMGVTPGYARAMNAAAMERGQ